MWKEFPKAKIKGVFSDLDDTLTDSSELTPETYSCLKKLHSAGFWTVIVSGRPAGWADCLMRLTSIDAMIFENGAGLMVREGKKIRTICLAANLDRESQNAKLKKIFDSLKKEIPALKLATDQAYRLFDFAIDYVEEPPFLSQAELNLVMKRLGEERETTAKLSSIHVNYWCGNHTKVTACEWLLENEGKKRGISKDQIVYSGDSPNDEPLFGFFEHTVGVANVKKYLDTMKSKPRYLTKSEGGKGFQELALELLQT